MEYEQVEVNSERWFDLKLLLNEEFRDIEGFEGLYQVSNYGRVKSLKLYYYNSKEKKMKFIYRNKILKYRLTKTKYCRVNLYLKKSIDFYVHRLVAQAFIKNINSKPCINHIDGNKANNRVDNLEWCTISENNLHAIKNNLRKTGKDNPLYGKKLKGEQLRKIREKIKELNKMNCKKVNQYDLQGNYIKTWNSCVEASKQFGKNKNRLISACASGNYKSAYGYRWEYLKCVDNT